MDMFTVLDVRDHIVCQSRLYDVAATYWTPGAILLRNGEPIAVGTDTGEARVPVRATRY